MSTIRVKTDELENVSSSLKSCMDEISRINNEFYETFRQIDWNIKTEITLMSVMQKLRNSLDKAEYDFDSHRKFLRNAIDKYNMAEGITKSEADIKNEADFEVKPKDRKKLSDHNPFSLFIDEINDAMDNRSIVLDSLAFMYTNIEVGIKEIINVRGESYAVQKQKESLAAIIDAMPNTGKDIISKDKIKVLKNIKDAGSFSKEILSLAEAGLEYDYKIKYGEELPDDLKQYFKQFKNIIKAIDWTKFTVEEINAILKDYTKNIEYLQLFRRNCVDAQMKEVIDSLLLDYNNKWYKTVMDVSEKVVDGVVSKGVGKGIKVLTGGSSLYSVLTSTMSVTSTVTGLNKKSEAIEKTYMSAACMNHIDAAYRSCIEQYNAGKCSSEDVINMLQMNKSAIKKIYEDMKGFANKDDMKLIEKRLYDINKMSATLGSTEGKSGMGGR